MANWLLTAVRGQSGHQPIHKREFYSNYFSQVRFVVSSERKSELLKKYQKCHHEAVRLIKLGIQRLGIGKMNEPAGAFRCLPLSQKFPIQVKKHRRSRGGPFGKRNRFTRRTLGF